MTSPRFSLFARAPTTTSTLRRPRCLVCWRRRASINRVRLFLKRLGQLFEAGFAALTFGDVGEVLLQQYYDEPRGRRARGETLTNVRVLFRRLGQLFQVAFVSVAGGDVDESCCANRMTSRLADLHAAES